MDHYFPVAASIWPVHPYYWSLQDSGSHVFHFVSSRVLCFALIRLPLRITARTLFIHHEEASDIASPPAQDNLITPLVWFIHATGVMCTYSWNSKGLVLLPPTTRQCNSVCPCWFQTEGDVIFLKHPRYVDEKTRSQHFVPLFNCSGGKRVAMRHLRHIEGWVCHAERHFPNIVARKKTLPLMLTPSYSLTKKCIIYQDQSWLPFYVVTSGGSSIHVCIKHGCQKKYIYIYKYIL